MFPFKTCFEELFCLKPFFSLQLNSSDVSTYTEYLDYLAVLCVIAGQHRASIKREKSLRNFWLQNDNYIGTENGGVAPPFAPQPCFARFGGYEPPLSSCVSTDIDNIDAVADTGLYCY